MADLTQSDKLKLEKLFSLDSGYVLSFSTPKFQQFIFNLFRIDILSTKYELLGTSKAKRLLAFWQIEGNITVGKSIKELLDVWETEKSLGDKPIEEKEKSLFSECKKISNRLLGKLTTEETNFAQESIETFLKKEFNIGSLTKLKIDSTVADILDKRIEEINKNINSGAALSAIIMCGSVLEGVLLGIATTRSKDFNQSACSPKSKTTDKVLQFNDWTLSNFIDVAFDIGLLGLDVKKHSHTLRDFRNYIHPFQQMSSRFNPDIDTSKISWQVLKAAISDLAKSV